MMGFGRGIYRLRNGLKHGLGTAYHREITRRRILRSGPVMGTPLETAEIHVLTSAQDWINLMWALRSFYVKTRRLYGLCVHDDGTLPAEAVSALQRQFPHARVVSRRESDTSALERLQAYPNCADFRRTNQLSPKLFDFLFYARSERILLLDSDVLFFEFPAALIERIEDPSYQRNSVNGDVQSAYTIDGGFAKREFGIDLIERFNSGLGLIHKSSMRLDWLEEFLSRPAVRGHFWRIEQTLFALLSSRHGVDLLPREYDVFLEGKVDERPSRHYVGAIRHRMYGEGLARLAGEGLLSMAPIILP